MAYVQACDENEQRQKDRDNKYKQFFHVYDENLQNRQ